MSTHRPRRVRYTRPAAALAGLAAITSLVLTGPTGARQPASPGAAASPAIAEAPAVWTVMPQRPVPARPGGVIVSAVEADVTIDGAVATTAMRITLKSSASRPLEAELVIPVPDGAAVRGFGLEGLAVDSDGNPTAELLPRDEARTIYRRIVNRMIDPGLLEFAGFNLIKSSVFPVPAQGEQVFRVTYEHVMPADGGRREYVLPRSEALDQIGAEWTIRTTIRSGDAGGTGDATAIFSPSHAIEMKREPGQPIIATVSGTPMRQPGPFRLTIVEAVDGDLPNAIVAYPDPAVEGGGGWFMFVAGSPDAARLPAIRREVTVVIDRSGSMRGEKIEQARVAALQIIEALDDGEYFNVIDYSDSIANFRPAAVAKSAETVAEVRAYLAAVKAIGGTNIRDAVVEALRPEPAEGTVPMVLFLTDGLPTIGTRSEPEIRAAARNRNAHGRRLFTFGVGYDVNAPLLTGMASDSRAVAAFVLPDEDVEVKVGGMFRKLGGPVLVEPQLVATGDGGGGVPVRDVQPAPLPDLFDGDQLVILGRYVGDAPVALELRGTSGDKRIVLEHTLDPKTVDTRHPYVPRLWAQRRIAGLIESVRLAGDESAATKQELVDEVIRLSLAHGILTEYTAFLAAERPDVMAVADPTNFGGRFVRGGGAGGGGGRGRVPAPGAGGVAGAPIAPPPASAEEARQVAGRELASKAVGRRAGKEAVNQDLNLQTLKADNIWMANFYLDADMNEVEMAGCQNVADRSLFRRGDRWIDSRILAVAIAAEDEEARAKVFEPVRTIVFGTEAYDELVDRLISERRQALIAIRGDLLLELDGRNVLVRNPA